MPTQKKFRDSIHAKGTEIAVLSTGDANDYISLTDIARYKSDAPDDVIKNWMRNRDTIEFLGLWEQLNNPNFKPVEFDGFRTLAGSNAFTMSQKKWIEATGAIGIISKAGRYGFILKTSIVYNRSTMEILCRNEARFHEAHFVLTVQIL